MSIEENLAWRAHLPTGWHGLYEQLVSDIGECDPSAKVTQAKEKFGELRVYLAQFQQDAYDLIDAASRVSRRSCQTCGEEALLCDQRGYFATLCANHRDGFVIASKDPILASLRMIDGHVEPVLRESAQFGEGQGHSDD